MSLPVVKRNNYYWSKLEQRKVLEQAECSITARAAQPSGEVRRNGLRVTDAFRVKPHRTSVSRAALIVERAAGLALFQAALA